MLTERHLIVAACYSVAVWPQFMRYRTILSAAFAVFFLIGGLLAYQKPFREYPAVEFYGFPLPPISAQKTVWHFRRLIYPPLVKSPPCTLAFPPPHPPFLS